MIRRPSPSPMTTSRKLADVILNRDRRAVGEYPQVQEAGVGPFWELDVTARVKIESATHETAPDLGTLSLMPRALLTDFVSCVPIGPGLTMSPRVAAVFRTHLLGPHAFFPLRIRAGGVEQPYEYLRLDTDFTGRVLRGTDGSPSTLMVPPEIATEIDVYPFRAIPRALVVSRRLADALLELGVTGAAIEASSRAFVEGEPEARLVRASRASPRPPPAPPAGSFGVSKDRVRPLGQQFAMDLRRTIPSVLQHLGLDGSAAPEAIVARVAAAFEPLRRVAPDARDWRSIGILALLWAEQVVRSKGWTWCDYRDENDQWKAAIQSPDERAVCVPTECFSRLVHEDVPSTVTLTFNMLCAGMLPPASADSIAIVS